MSSKALILTLKRDKEQIAEIALTQGSEPILVGRAHECVLKLPADDFSASSKHAKIFWKGSSLMIEDAGSRNGIYQDGKLVKRATKLKPGSLYAIGACLLHVRPEERNKKLKTANRYHRLEFLNGDNAGRIVDIKPNSDGTDFDIGLDPKCSVHLSDMLVSRRHAVLKTREGGECWIEDLGSRNGTFVNGERLSGKERLLRDGDTISVAFFEFRFLDRSVTHTRVQAWVKLAVIAVTVCVMAALYIAWTALRLPVETCLANARSAAARTDFDAARRHIAASRSARDAAGYRQQIDSLASQIEVWEKTRTAWEKARKNIATAWEKAQEADEKERKEIVDTRLKTALSILDALVSGPADSWGWNPKEMVSVKKESDFAAKALHLYFDGMDVINAAAKNVVADADIKVRNIIGPIEGFLRDHKKTVEEGGYMFNVMKLMDDLLKDLRVINEGYNIIDNSIAKISATNPSFHNIYEAFERISANEKYPGAVRGYARQQLAPCRAFVKAQDFLEDELAQLLRLDFKGVREKSEDIVLPNQDLCIRHARYSDARSFFAERHRQLQKEASALETMIGGLAACGITMDGRGDDIDLFVDTKNIEKALSFDCFSRRPPNARRPEPVGMYDTLFGIEWTFESLSALPKSYSGRNRRSMAFTPRCISARQAFDHAANLVQYLEGDDRRYLQHGDIGRYYTQCVRITIERERLVQWLKDYKGTDRAEIVASFYADFFSPDPTDVAKRALSQRFAKLKREVIALDEKYKFEMDPEKQLALREKIIETGIPGDQLVHSRWAQKFD